MNVVAFAPPRLQQDGQWKACELERMRATFGPELANGEASGWQAAATEIGDPQFFLMGPLPAEDCVLAISRLGRLYVLEDGAGHVVFEHVSLARLAEQAKIYLREAKSGLVAGALMLWASLRQILHEKVEPVLAEGEELLMHLAPQLGAIA